MSRTECRIGMQTQRTLPTRTRRFAGIPLAGLTAVALLCLSGAAVAFAERDNVSGVIPQTTAAGIVRGGVHDSIVGQALPGAIVQLVSADPATSFGRTEMSDSAGLFEFADVPDGRYTIGFFHPMQDSLGIEPTLRAVTLTGQSLVRVDLAIPSPSTLRAAICGAATADSSAAVVMGFVRDAQSGSPKSGSRVTAEWVELSLGRGGFSRRTPRRNTNVRESGWYAICNVPSPGAIRLMASHEHDSTDFVEIDVPDVGFLRRDLYVGAAGIRMVTDSAASVDSVRLPMPLKVGSGRVRGSVVTSVGRRPVAGAQVAIVGGPRTRTNERGEWLITDAPTGTRSVEVRAVGFYPETRAINIIDQAPPVVLALATFKSVLDTMKVIANYDRFSNLAGFRERSKTSLGRYVTEADIARRQPIVTSDLFRNFPGLFLDAPRGTVQFLEMRGAFTERCVPSVYLNGAVMNNLSATDIDAFVSPRDIIGIEVYSQTQAPAQFQLGLSGCGSVVIWTR